MGRFLGGSGDDRGMEIAVDGSGNAYVTGRTQSANFQPVLDGFQMMHNRGGSDAFVARFNSLTGS